VAAEKDMSPQERRDKSCQERRDKSSQERQDKILCELQDTPQNALGKWKVRSQVHNQSLKYALRGCTLGAELGISMQILQGNMSYLDRQKDSWDIQHYLIQAEEERLKFEGMEESHHPVRKTTGNEDTP